MKALLPMLERVAKMGKPMRAALGGGTALIAAVKKGHGDVVEALA